MKTLKKTDIDWGKMAKPCDDGYDSKITIKFAKKYGYKGRRMVDVPTTALDGTIAIREMEYPNEVTQWCEQGPLKHPNIHRSFKLLSHWEEGYDQFLKLIDTIYPIKNVQVSGQAFPKSLDKSSNLILGSSSHSEWKRFGSLYTTVNDPIGTAQAFVHEMAHQKLRSLGIQVESTDRIIKNSMDELYESPVRKDKLRPMTAVFHATYAWIYIVQLDLKMVQHQIDKKSESIVVNLFLQYLKRNLIPLDSGINTMKKYLKEDDEGVPFFEGLYKWYDDILYQTFELL